MTLTNKYTNGVSALTLRAKNINPQIGSYQEHYFNENGDFTVKVTSGWIKMSLEVAQDYEANPLSVMPDRIKTVAQSFVVK